MWFELEYYRDHAEDTRPSFWEKHDGLLGLNGTYEHVFSRNIGDCQYLHEQSSIAYPMATITWSSYYSPTSGSYDQTAQFYATGGSSPYVGVNYSNYNKKYTYTPTPYPHEICRGGEPSWIWEYDTPGNSDVIVTSDADIVHLTREFSDDLGLLGKIDTFYQFVKL